MSLFASSHLVSIGDITQTGLNDTSLSACVNVYIHTFLIRVRLAICFVKSFMRLCLSKAIDLCHVALYLHGLSRSKNEASRANSKLF